MLISNIINDSLGLLSKQLRFYCWHFRCNLDQRQRRELIELLHEQHFERLANKIRILNQSSVADCKQQIGKLLFEHCLSRNRRHQLVQLIESRLVDINVRLDNYGRTLLHRSAYNLDVELVKILIEYGVNIKLRDYAGNTALHIAIQSYRNGAVIYGDGPNVVQNLTSIIQLLLEADRHLQNERCKHKRLKLSLDESTLPTNNSSTNNEPLSEEDETIDTVEAGATKLGTPIYSFLKRGEGESDFPRLHVALSPNNSRKSIKQVDQSSHSIGKQKGQDFLRRGIQSDESIGTISPMLLEDASSPLVDTKNAFGRTALHYCVLVVGEQHLAHFVKLLLSFGADPDVVDTRMKTPLYCLVKRPGISAIRQKTLAITHLVNCGCDDLGLSINLQMESTEKLLQELERDLPTNQHSKSESPPEPIFENSTFKRVPRLKHIARLKLIRVQDEKNKLKRQIRFTLPRTSPALLNLYINRRILDQTELF